MSGHTVSAGDAVSVGDTVSVEDTVSGGTTVSRSPDRTESRSGDLFLERIPEGVYDDLIRSLSERYGFVNGLPAGGRLRCSEYFLGLRRSAANGFFECIRTILHDAQRKKFPVLPLPDGFHPQVENLPPFDREGGIPFGYFDAAVTAEGLRIIEVQSNATYGVTAAFIGDFLRDTLDVPGSSTFVHADGDRRNFLEARQEILAGDATEGVIVADRDLARQKTKFEHNATQHEFQGTLDLVDTRWIFECDGYLWYRTHEDDSNPKRVRRIYHRTLALEAIEEDGYPHSPERWKFRFDQPYRDLVHVSHPGLNFRISKHILPYVDHPLNPECHELSTLAEPFRRGEIGRDEFVWKHKLGVAGRGLFLLPDEDILANLTADGQLGEYIAQRKVEFERFTTGDGLEKIVELRFMTTQTADQLFVVPMARVGHIRTHANGRSTFHIHFGENNHPGYGFCPVIVVDDDD